VDATIPGYEGYVDTVDNGLIFGWAWHSAHPDEPISVDLYVDGEQEASIVAGLYRADLAVAGKGSGMHAFEIRLPDQFRDGDPHVVRFCYHGTQLDLHGSPRNVAVGARPLDRTDPQQAERRAALDARIRVRLRVRPFDHPKVSVIIPCYNIGHYLDDAVDSVLEQTFEDFEILIVDDGSTNRDTRALIDGYDRPKTRVLSAAHQGVSGARNVGIEHSVGEYLCFLDADDKLDPLFLEKTIAPLERDQSLSFVSCWLRTFGSEDWVWRQDRCDLPALLAECTVLTAAPVRRTAVNEAGGFDPAMGQLFAEDWDLWISIVRNGRRGIILPEVLFHYRRYADSNSRRWEDPRFVGRVARALVARHETSYREHLFEVLLLKERRAGELLRINYDLQREVDVELTPKIAGRKDQVEHLRRRLDAARSPKMTPPEVEANPTREETDVAVGDMGIDWGDLDRLSPLSSDWGFDRGTPIDRYYIEGFLRAHSVDIRGDVLEVGENKYTRRFGGERVLSSAVVDINPANPVATFLADLRDATSIPSGSFDCFIMTQTAYLIDDIAAVLSESARMLRPGGVLLATLPCAIRLEPETGLDADFWRIGPNAAAALFRGAFPEGRITVTAYGNLLTTVAFLYGLAHEEITAEELDASDPRFPLTIGIRALAADVPNGGTGGLR
jgi:glycosyltransferase involved in cell wall biosynthesis/SAM-dependent methyltransferase